MSLEMNLLARTEISKYRIAFGVFLCIFGIARIFFGIRNGEIIAGYDWMISLIFLLGGILHIMLGTGCSFSNYFGGKAYISIDKDHIIFKPSIIKKEQIILWDDIKAIEYRSALYKIAKTNGELVSIELPALDYELIQKIKSTISSIAGDKKIEIR